MRKSDVGTIHHDRFNPIFVVDGMAVGLHALEVVSVPLETLGEPVASLAEDGNRIVNALDELFTRAFG